MGICLLDSVWIDCVWLAGYYVFGVWCLVSGVWYLVSSNI